MSYGEEVKAKTKTERAGQCCVDEYSLHLRSFCLLILPGDTLVLTVS